ncbi:hypothetical protein DFH29DRAFT_882369 [Suillus ampliporus]|nr:hypothetical protein DFH29DRAFT_882369 [Suillus ampliporus]
MYKFGAWWMISCNTLMAIKFTNLRRRQSLCGSCSAKDIPQTQRGGSPFVDHAAPKISPRLKEAAVPLWIMQRQRYPPDSRGGSPLCGSVQRPKDIPPTQRGGSPFVDHAAPKISPRLKEAAVPLWIMQRQRYPPDSKRRQSLCGSCSAKDIPQTQGGGSPFMDHAAPKISPRLKEAAVPLWIMQRQRYPPDSRRRQSLYGSCSAKDIPQTQGGGSSLMVHAQPKEQT